MLWILGGLAALYILKPRGSASQTAGAGAGAGAADAVASEVHAPSELPGDRETVPLTEEVL